MPRINNLEEAMHNTWKKRTETIIQRRRQDIKDMSVEYAPKDGRF